MSDTKRSELISTQLRQIAEQAIEHPDRVFTTLIHRMGVEFLREAYHRLPKDGAAGLSGVPVKDYGRELEANLVDLHERLKEQRYVAPRIKRVWIDKEGGKKKRPIGLLEIEDKIVQKAVSMLLGAVYEQDFHPFSYGFREERTAHQALGAIREPCMEQGIRWIYDADIRRPQTFSFLGFTHYVHRSRRGYFVVGRRTERKRLHRKLQELNECLSSLRVRGGTAMLRYFRQHMQGHIQYYGVSGNYRQLAAYAYFASRLLYKWLNRRSQRRSTDWARFRATLHSRWLPPLRICHNPYPEPSWKTQAGSRMV